MPLKRTVDSASRAGGAIERFIERTLAPRLEELAGEIRGLRGELGQFDKRMGESATSLRSEIASLRNETVARIDSLRTEVNSRFEAVNARIESSSTQVNGRIDALSQRLDDALNIRERLVALEAKVEAQKRNGA